MAQIIDSTQPVVHVETEKSKCYTIDNYLPDEMIDLLFQQSLKLPLLTNPACPHLLHYYSHTFTALSRESM